MTISTPHYFLASRETKSNLGIPFQEITQLRLHFADGDIREITCPVIGRDFFAGFLEDGLSYLVIKRECVIGIDFRKFSGSSPFLSTTRLSATEVLAQRPLPQGAQLSFVHQAAGTRWAMISGVVRSLILLSDHTTDAVPFAALNWVILDPVKTKMDGGW